MDAGIMHFTASAEPKQARTEVELSAKPLRGKDRAEELHRHHAGRPSERYYGVPFESQLQGCGALLLNSCAGARPESDAHSFLQP